MSEPTPKSVENQANVVGGGAAVVTSYMAFLAAQKWSIPFEVAGAAVGIITQFASMLVRRIAKLPAID